MANVVRALHPGMGQAVGERTVLRYFLHQDEFSLVQANTLRISPHEPKEFYQKWNTAALNSRLHVEITDEAPIRNRAPKIVFERWEDVARRVAAGNAALCSDLEERKYEQNVLFKHIANAALLMSGRHLQHGDTTQPERNQEVFTNCATAAASFALFYLLLNGSGVGRSYDDDMVLVDWDNAPTLRCVLDSSHPDFDYSAHESVRDARHKYGNGRNVLWYKVPDTREGWAKVVEIFENAAFEKIHAGNMLILDFSDVRGRGSPIKGMQNRPSSGPVPLMNALLKVASLKGAGLPVWLQAMYADHYLAECVLVGGARRAARMATKTWRDKSVLDFIGVKRPIEYEGSKMDEVIAFRAEHTFPPQSFLWSSNNSVTVDAEFWRLLNIKRGAHGYDSDLARHARKVFKLLSEYSYGDGTGEPGLINIDKLVQNNEGLDDVLKGDYFGSKKYQIEDDTQVYMRRLAKRASRKKYPYITNPCGEIALHVLGGFCVIADVVPFHAQSLDDAEEAFRAATRALMRVNTMDSVYNAEVRRTNRIGIGMTGVHEFAWKFFKLGFKDLIDEDISQEFWNTLARFNAAVIDEATRYALKLGVQVPHTMLTIKPAGTTSKLFGLTEGWHLPAMARYLRWVQFRNDDPLVEQYESNGYPVRKLRTYEGTSIVGFPTEPTLTTLGLGDALVTAAEATPEEQYQWLKLGEKYFIKGLTGQDVGNQISYTLKYNASIVDHKHFADMLKKHQSEIRCCSVMPQEDGTAYEYQPEEPVTKARYESVAASIQQGLAEDVDREHVDCASGACPIDFEKGAA